MSDLTLHDRGALGNVQRRPPSCFGLVAHRRHLQTGGGLSRWLQACEPAIRALGLGLHAVGGTCNAMEREGLLVDYPLLKRLPYGHEGGLMRLVSRVVGGVTAGDGLDGVIHLIDPVDASSVYPEAQALKRQCVIHGKPFVGTVAGAVEWMAIEMLHAGQDITSIPGSARLFALEQQTVALVAHDALKDRMVAFAGTHFDTLSRYRGRIATGTTGTRLNQMAWQRGWPKSSEWVKCYLSGPLGGDAQIAELVLDRRCQKVIFFEDPHVARQHEADIQLLERAVGSTSDETSCFNSPMMAERWAAVVSKPV